MIEFHRLGRIIVLNDDLYLISEKRFIQILGLNKPRKKLIKTFNEERIHKESQKLCNKVKKYGKILGSVDLILRDD